LNPEALDLTNEAELALKEYLTGSIKYKYPGDASADQPTDPSGSLICHHKYATPF
jgi:hypothetical protein